MNGARALIQTLVDCGVDTCFTNPGTYEMHFVAALDAVPEMRGVLALFEGVATGAADGYARLANHPAATLLHLGPGLGNGLANLHNARKGQVPILNIVGDHATYHKQYDAQLESDIATVARNCSGWLRTSARPADAGADAADAVAAAYGPPGQVATLILPADVCWLEGGVVASPRRRAERAPVPQAALDEAARALRSGEPAALLVGGSVLRERGLVAASRVANASRARLLCETFPGPARARRRPAADPAPRLPARARDAAARGPPSSRPRRREGAGQLLRLPEQAERAGARRLHRAHARDRPRGRRRCARSARGSRRGAGRRCDAAGRRAAGATHRGAHRRQRIPDARRAAARGRRGGRRGEHLGSLRAGAH